MINITHQVFSVFHKVIYKYEDVYIEMNHAMELLINLYFVGMF